MSFVSCTNSGDLTSEKYVGGILGLDASNTTTKIVFDSCTSSGQVASTQTSGTASLGSFAGYTKSLNLVFEGNNSAECVFSFDDSLEYVGGAVGFSSKIDETSMEAILKDHVTVSDACAQSVKSDEDLYRGKYCGNPWIDSL